MPGRQIRSAPSPLAAVLDETGARQRRATTGLRKRTMLRSRYQAAHGGYSLRKSRESRALSAIRADRCMLDRALTPLGGQT